MKTNFMMDETKGDYGVYAPDLSGFLTVGKSKEEVLDLIREAVEIHLGSIDEEISCPEAG